MWLGDQDIRATENQSGGETYNDVVQYTCYSYELRAMYNRRRLLQKEEAGAGNDITDSALANRTPERTGQNRTNRMRQDRGNTTIK